MSVYQLYPLISGKGRNSGAIVLRPRILKNCKDEPFVLEDEQLKFYASGEVNVPAKFMKEHGHLCKDGRYVIAILPMLRPLNGKLVRGAVIPNIPGIEDTLENVCFNDIITYDNGTFTIEHPDIRMFPKSLWYGEDYLLKEVNTMPEEKKHCPKQEGDE